MKTSTLHRCPELSPRDLDGVAGGRNTSRVKVPFTDAPNEHATSLADRIYTNTFDLTKGSTQLALPLVDKDGVEQDVLRGTIWTAVTSKGEPNPLANAVFFMSSEDNSADNIAALGWDRKEGTVDMNYGLSYSLDALKCLDATNGPAVWQDNPTYCEAFMKGTAPPEAYIAPPGFVDLQPGTAGDGAQLLEEW